MALPQAQLGQMGSLSAPHQLQAQVINKEPKAWERALLSLLSNVGSAVVQQGVGNAMAQDYAPEFGETAATGTDRFFKGPRVGERQAAERRSLAQRGKESDSADRNARLNRMVELTGQNRAMERATMAETGRVEGEIGNRLKDQGTEEIALTQLRQQGAHQRLQDLVAQIGKERQARVGDAQIGEISAQTQERLAKAAQMELQNKLMADAANGGKKPAAGVNPNVAKFAAGGAPVAATPTSQSPDSQIASLVDSGIPPDQIVQQLAAIQSRQAAVQTRADQYEISDVAREERRQATIDAIRRKLGLTTYDEGMAAVPGFLP